MAHIHLIGGIQMPTNRQVTVHAVPPNTIFAFRRAAQGRRAQMTEVINWAVQVLAKSGKYDRLYWTRHDIDEVTEVDLSPMPRIGDGVDQVVNLSSRAFTAFEKIKRRYQCDGAEVLGRAVWIAPYFGRTDGQLASGRYFNLHRPGGRFGVARFLT